MSVGESPRKADAAPVQSWEQAVRTVRDDPGNNALARDCYFDGSAAEAAQRYWSSEEWQAVRLMLPAVAGQALDVGAGRGIASYALAREGWKVCALEPDPSTLVGAGAIRDLAISTGYSIEVCEAFGEELPFADGRFSLIIARQCLHHARDLRALLRQLYRVLSPGGRLIALRDHVISRPGDLGRFQAVHPLHRLYGGEHAYLLGEYTEAIKGAGFELRRVIAPLESPINFAPIPESGLADAIADQLSGGRVVKAAARRLLSSRAILSVALQLLRRVDDRPGRLYSFIADRPGA